MRCLLISGILALLSVHPSPAKAAAQMTVADLQVFCRTSDPQVKPACKFYILGAFEGLSLAGSSEKKGTQFVVRTHDRHYCVPDNLSSDEMQKKVVAMMEADLRVFPDDAKLP